MIHNNEFTFSPDWERDGFLVYENAKTLERYHELRREQSNVDTKKFDVFFAFSNEQFKEGLKSIRPLADGEKLVSIGGGGFATKDGAERFYEYLESIDAKIKAECDPQEVYVYEYNNYECCIAYDGDLEAIKTVLSLFGEDAARKIKRYNATMSIDDLVRKPVNIEGLYFWNDDNETVRPKNVWFSDYAENKGKCFSMFGGVLYPVCTVDGEAYINADLAGLSARYDGKVIYNYYKD